MSSINLLYADELIVYLIMKDLTSMNIKNKIIRRMIRMINQYFNLFYLKISQVMEIIIGYIFYLLVIKKEVLNKCLIIFNYLNISLRISINIQEH